MDTKEKLAVLNPGPLVPHPKPFLIGILFDYRSAPQWHRILHLCYGAEHGFLAHDRSLQVDRSGPVRPGIHKRVPS